MVAKDVSQQIIKETQAQAEKINTVQFGKVTYIIQSGKIQRIEFNDSIAVNSLRGGQ